MLAALPWLPPGVLGAGEAAAATGEGRFRNPLGSPERGGTASDWIAFSWRRLRNDGSPTELPPGHVLPPAEVRAGLERLGERDGVTWLGHAAFLVRLGGRVLVTDPFLSDHASPYPPLGPRRFAPPGLRPDGLPPADLVLLSHNHYDHLDLPSLERLPGRERATLVTATGVGRYLSDVPFARVVELGWHERVLVADGELAVTALPAIHFSKRGLFDRDATLWCGFLVEHTGTGRLVYFAGDTAYGPVFPELGARYPAPDLALVPIGAYEPRHMMKGTHCTPEEGLRLGLDLRARILCAMHWGAIRLTDEPSFEPPGRFLAAAAAAGLPPERAWALKVGETRAF